MHTAPGLWSQPTEPVRTTRAHLLAGRRTTPVADVARRANIALLVLGVVHLLGVVVAGRTRDGTGSFTRCVSWPLWAVIDLDGPPLLQLFRLGLVVGALVLCVMLAWRARLIPAARRASVVLLGLALAEIAMGLIIPLRGLDNAQTNGISTALAITYSLTAVAILAVLAQLAAVRETTTAGGTTNGASRVDSLRRPAAERR